MPDPPARVSVEDDRTQTEAERAPSLLPIVGPRFSPGTTIGHYELIRQLGQGGMGDVYLARDTRLGRRVALKFLLKVDRKHSARFLIEARATAQLAHENIVALYDFAERDGLPYMALEYVPGTTLSAWLRNRYENHPSRAVPATRAAELMLPVARALQCAHDAGIVHRDLKPSNIMLTESGTVKVLDFGVAKLLGEAAGTNDAEPSDLRSGQADNWALTEAGLLVGTRAYMAPEQWWGETVDGRADLWAVGVMLYQLVAGDHPLGALSPESLQSVAVREEPMPSIREVMPDLGRLGAVIDRCLIKTKEDRLGSARELVEQLEAIVRPHQSSLEQGTEEINPYAGLAAFQERDAARFFGRETTVEHIVSRLVERPLLALVGASGAGKSSLVRAGVIPALLRGGDAWESFILRPGPRPLAALADMLLQHSWHRSSQTADSQTNTRREAPGADAVITRLRKEPGYLGVQLRARAQKRRERALLFIDQFEEIYTLAPEDERTAFLSCLAGAADDPSSPVRVVVSIRHDFLDRVALGSPVLAELISRGTVLVGPLDRRGLQRALVAPAEALSYRFESESLVTEMLDTLEHTAGALPLLQFTAAMLWTGRDVQRRMLTESCYRGFGGVAGALTSHADTVISSMSDIEKNWARVLILRLVTPERTRAVVSRRDLSEIGGPEIAHVERVLGLLVDARLLVVESTRGGESTVELVHESLIERWPRLASWLDQADDYAQFRGRLRNAAKEWEASGRSEGLVWRGDAVEETRHFWKDHGERNAQELNARETDYVQAVLGLWDRERRLRRRMKAIAFISIAIVMVVISSLALLSRRDAQRAWAGEMEAQAQKNEAQMQKLAAERSAARARDVTRMAAAGQLTKDPLLMLSVLREIESGTPPRGWRERTTQALAANDLATMVFAHDDVRTAAWSPDGKRIASASTDKTVRIWNVDGSDEPIVVRGHSGNIDAVAWSPNGTHLASASDDHTVRVWNIHGTGEPVVLRGHKAGIGAVAWHPDGTQLFTGSVDNTMGVWKADGTGTTMPIDAHYGDMSTAAWSPDRTRVVTGGHDGKIRVWPIDFKAEPTVLGAHDTPVWTAKWSPDGTHIVSGAEDGTVRIWNADGSGQSIVLQGYPARKVTIAISPDSRHVAFSGDANALKIARMDGSGHALEFRTGNDIWELAYSPDGRQIASVERNGTIHVWDVARIMKSRVFRGHKGSVSGAVWNPDGEQIASVGDDNTLRIWNVKDGSAPPLVFEYSAAFFNVAWSPDGKRIAASAQDKTIGIWNADGSDKPQILRGHDKLVHGIAWSPQGSLLASCSSDQTVRLWNADGSPTSTIFRHASIVYTVAFSPDGQRIVSSSKDSTARIWNVDGSGEAIVLPHETSLYGAAFSPDGKYVITGAQDRIMRRWNADGTGKPLEFRGHASVVGIRGARVFTPTGTRIVSSSDDGTTGLWNTDGSGEPLFLRTSNEAVNMASFSPDGKRVVTASDDGNVTIWDDLEPLTGRDDSRLWEPTRYCMPLDVRLKLLDFSEEQSRADLAWCKAHRSESRP